MPTVQKKDPIYATYIALVDDMPAAEISSFAMRTHNEKVFKLFKELSKRVSWGDVNILQEEIPNIKKHIKDQLGKMLFDIFFKIPKLLMLAGGVDIMMDKIYAVQTLFVILGKSKGNIPDNYAKKITGFKKDNVDQIAALLNVFVKQNAKPETGLTSPPKKLQVTIKILDQDFHKMLAHANEISIDERIKTENAVNEPDFLKRWLKYIQHVKEHNDKVIQMFDELIKDMEINTSQKIADLQLNYATQNIYASLALYCRFLLIEPYFRILLKNASYFLTTGTTTFGNFLENKEELLKFYPTSDINEDTQYNFTLDVDYSEILKYLNYERISSMQLFFSIICRSWQTDPKTIKDFFNQYTHLGMTNTSIPTYTNISTLLGIFDSIPIKQKAILLRREWLNLNE